MPAIATLKPKAITNIRNFTPNDVSYLQDSPAAVDTKNLTTVFTVPASTPCVDLSFEIPGKLTGTQTVNVHYTDNNWVGLHIEILESGVKKHTSATVYTGYGNQISPFNFNADILTDKTAKNMQVRVIGHYYNGLTINYLSAVELVASYEKTAEMIVGSLRTNWTASDYYNFEDLNRVEEMTLVIKDQIKKMRNIDISLETNLSRNEKTIEFAESLNRIENNILKLKVNFPYTGFFNISKTNWSYNQPFDYNDANRLEQDLHKLYYFFKTNLENIPYPGMYTAGQEGVY
jgi:hypothetical protein